MHIQYAQVLERENTNSKTALNTLKCKIMVWKKKAVYNFYKVYMAFVLSPHLLQFYFSLFTS